MKTVKHIGLLVLFVISTACEKSPVSEAHSDGPFYPGEFSAVSINGDLKLVFDKKQSAEEEANVVSIHANQGQRSKISVDNQSGILKVRADQDIQLEDGVELHISCGDLTEIRVEANQRCIVTGRFNQEKILIVTQSNSQLRLEELAVNQLRMRQGGGSLLEVSSLMEDYSSQNTYSRNEASLIAPNTLLLSDQILLSSDSVSSDASGFQLHGINNKAYHLLKQLELTTLGTATFKGFAAPTSKAAVNLQGSSGAQLWVLDSLGGSASGDSFLSYRGRPDTSQFQLYADARLIAD